MYFWSPFFNVIRIRLFQSPERTCHHRISLLCEMSHPNLQTAPSDHTYDSCNLYPNTKSGCLEFHLMWLSLIRHDPLHLIRDYYLLEHNWKHDYHLLICTHLHNGHVYGSYNTQHLIYYKCLIVLRDHVPRAKHLHDSSHHDLCWASVALAANADTPLSTTSHNSW